MTTQQQPIPTEAELEILQILWQKGPSTVRVINDEQNKNKEVGYTTTLKLMQIMLDKKILSRNEETRTHIYSPLITEDSVQSTLLNKFLDATFRGSATKLVMQALGNHTTSKEELSQIKDLINKIEVGKK